MSFGISPTQLLSVGDQQNVIWRSFLQALIDHGGREAHLDKLLANTKTSRKLLNEFAELVVGPIWKLTHNSIELEQIDYLCSFEQFLSRYPHVDINTDVQERNRLWIGNPPYKRCRYQLFHFDKTASFNEILRAVFGSCNMEHADIRELIAYTARLGSEDLCLCSIIAAGSQLACHPHGDPHSEWRSMRIFPKAYAIHSNIIDTAEEAVGHSEEEKTFNTTNFFLVRVYD